MYSKLQLQNKLYQLKSYSISRNPNTSELFIPLDEAFNKYFGSNASSISSELNDTVKYLYADIMRRTMKFENEFDKKLPTDYPTGYYNLEECFTDFSEIINISNEAFYNGFVGEAEVVTSNTYIDKWVSEFNSDADLNKIQALTNWCRTSHGDSPMINLLEDQGNVKVLPKKEELINKIYLDRKLLIIIKLFELSTYIPTKLR